MLEKVYEFLKSILLAIVIAIFLEKYIFGLTIVDGKSMFPTIDDHDTLFVNKIVYRMNKPQWGDIVIFHPPIKERSKEFFIKRVIAVENDVFKIHQGKLFINGHEVEESYIGCDQYEERAYDMTQGRVPKGMVFVMGDNRNDSNDSRCFGFVPVANIVGKANMRIWPLKEAKAFTAKAYR